MSGGASWDRAVFDRIYGGDPDPWRFETSDYEREKYDRTLALLPPGRRFGNALELGCSIGVFTRRLAPRCDRLLALDCAPRALAIARDRSAGDAAIRFAEAMLPDGFPDGRFDLVVVSEILYFLSAADIGRLADRLRAAVEPGALVLVANWTGPTDTPTTGDEAASLLIAGVAPALMPRAAETHALYRLDLLAAA